MSSKYDHMLEQKPQEFDPWFPRPGAKLTYKGTHIFWFTNLIENAEKNLVKGQVYTLKKISVASSWCHIWLEETGDIDYSLSFFDYEPCHP
jgi:hypothetical protein